jgi:HD superfamily phosphodiesterase
MTKKYRKLEESLFLALDRILKNTQEYNQEMMHNKQVVMNIKKLLKTEKGNKRILIPAAIFHDIANYDPKFRNDLRLKKYLLNVLKPFSYTENEINCVFNCIKRHSRRGTEKPRTQDEKMVFDADNLTILTPFGIARWFYMARGWGGKYSLEETIKELINISKEIKKNAIFYTKTAKRIMKNNVYFNLFVNELNKNLKKIK